MSLWLTTSASAGASFRVEIKNWEAFIGGGFGQNGGEYRAVYATPELANEPGPVTFWVERRDGGSVHKVSPTYTIP